MLSYESFVESSSNTLLECLSRMAQDGKAVPISDWLQYYAFDVIGAVTVGEPFGFLEHGHDFQGILREVSLGQIYGVLVGFFWSSLHYPLMRLAEMVGYELPRQATQTYVRKSVAAKQELIDQGETTEEHSGKQDLLEKLFMMKEKGKVNDWDIQNAVSANVNAGLDTTSISLSAIVYYLTKNPAVMERLRAEIETARREFRASTPITFNEAQELPYLQAVIKEALRLHSAVGVPLPRVVPAGGATLAGQFFPAGSVVAVNSWVIHHNRQAFGPDADVFRPERWLVESKEHAKELDRYLLTFGAGSRTCIGRHIAMLEINKVVPELVTRFDFELENPKQEWELQNVLFVKPAYNCYVRERLME